MIETKDEAHMEEGCLSFPNLFLKVKRPMSIKAEYFDRHNNKCIIDANTGTITSLGGLNILDDLILFTSFFNFYKGCLYCEKYQAITKKAFFKGDYKISEIYNDIEFYAPLILIIMRLIQGLCISGEGAGAGIGHNRTDLGRAADRGRARRCPACAGESLLK